MEHLENEASPEPRLRVGTVSHNPAHTGRGRCNACVELERQRAAAAGVKYRRNARIGCESRLTFRAQGRWSRSLPVDPVPITSEQARRPSDRPRALAEPESVNGQQDLPLDGQLSPGPRTPEILVGGQLTFSSHQASGTTHLPSVASARRSGRPLGSDELSVVEQSGDIHTYLNEVEVEEAKRMYEVGKRIPFSSRGSFFRFAAGGRVATARPPAHDLSGISSPTLRLQGGPKLLGNRLPGEQSQLFALGLHQIDVLWRSTGWPSTGAGAGRVRALRHRRGDAVAAAAPSLLELPDLDLVNGRLQRAPRRRFSRLT